MIETWKLSSVPLYKYLDVITGKLVRPTVVVVNIASGVKNATTDNSFPSEPD